LSAQSLLWFGIAGGAALFGAQLLRERYVKKDQRAVRSRGGFTLFAIFAFIFAAGALIAGLASL
jgi:hypothetical protein